MGTSRGHQRAVTWPSPGRFSWPPSIVLIGKETASSGWVANEIAWSLEKGNGLVGILLDEDAAIPEALTDAGVEILSWSSPDDVSEFGDAIERAAAATRAAANMPTNSVSTCARA